MTDEDQLLTAARQGPLTRTQARRLLGCATHTDQVLSQLCDHGRLRRDTVGPGQRHTIYVVPERLIARQVTASELDLARQKLRTPQTRGGLGHLAAAADILVQTGEVVRTSVGHTFTYSRSGLKGRTPGRNVFR